MVNITYSEDTEMLEGSLPGNPGMTSNYSLLSFFVDEPVLACSGEFMLCTPACAGE